MSSNTVKIYRLETVAGNGMYADCSAQKVMWHTNEQHPSPESDRLLKHLFEDKTHQDYFYGFSSVKACREWVPYDAWLEQLHELGIVLSVYVCPREAVVHGVKQSMFKEHISKTQHNLLDYFRLNKYCMN